MLPSQEWEEVTWYETRWQCACGRFVREDSIQSEDVPDATQWFGLDTHTWAHCSRCGYSAEPRCIPTVERRVIECRI